MKKILYLTTLIFFFSACSDNLSDLNKNPKGAEELPAGVLIANATVELFDLMTDPNNKSNNFRLFSQQWTYSSYPLTFSTFPLQDEPWNKLYTTVLKDLHEARQFIDVDLLLGEDEKLAQHAIISTMEVLAYSILADMFGDVPYNAIQGEDHTPVYTDDEEIYDKLINKLNLAINHLQGNSKLNSFDLIYNGNTDAWRKFANALKLRLAIRIAEVDNSKAKKIAEEAVADGVFGSNADNFQLVYQNSPPHTNPLWVALVQSGRSDFIVCSTIADYMNNLNDPRRSYYFSDLDADGNVLGANHIPASYTYFSHAGSKQNDPTFPGVLLDYSEVCFLLADAGERGFNVGASPADFYHEGITSSILAWGGSISEANTYATRADVAYATASGTWKEKIALQKWLALYNRGFEAWTTYRFYDFPVFEEGSGFPNFLPNRFPYPSTEYILNEENVRASGNTIEGNALNTEGKVFWDVN